MDDLISRKAAIDALRKAEPLTRAFGYHNVIDAIRELPSAQPERQKGEWVGVHAYCNHKNEEAKVNGKSERYLPSGMVIGVYCNQCWCRADKKSDFCPNCGADMRGEEDEIDRC